MELPWLGAGSVRLSGSGMMRWASTLPSSTPHWSNELICQMAPWVNAECSYRATSLPKTAGVSRSVIGCFLQDSAFRINYRHQVVPGLDERFRPFVLKLGGQLVDIDTGLGELTQHFLAIAAVCRQDGT